MSDRLCSSCLKSLGGALLACWFCDFAALVLPRRPIPRDLSCEAVLKISTWSFRMKANYKTYEVFNRKLRKFISKARQKGLLSKKRLRITPSATSEWMHKCVYYPRACIYGLSKWGKDTLNYGAQKSPANCEAWTWGNKFVFMSGL